MPFLIKSSKAFNLIFTFIELPYYYARIYHEQYRNRIVIALQELWEI